MIKDEFIVDRKYQDFFCSCLELLGFDNYGMYCETKNVKYIKNNKYNTWYEDEIFSIASFYWGDNKSEINRDNFIYKPTNIIINWYKYPLRGAVSNIKITEKNLFEMFSSIFKHYNIKEKELLKRKHLYLDILKL